MEACTNPDILRVIYFFLLMVDIVKIVIPIALIVLGIVDFSKSVVISDEKVHKKTLNLFLKRMLYAVLVFAVPWIIEVVMVNLGNAIDEEVNFTDCLDNANAECIEALENQNMGDTKKLCDVGNDFKFKVDKYDDETEKCWYCPSKKAYYWGKKSPLEKGEPCPGTSDTNWFVKGELGVDNCK